MVGGAKTVNQFWSKINGKKLQSSLHPSAKERVDLNFWRDGVIIREEFDGAAQNGPVFQNEKTMGQSPKFFEKIEKILMSKNETSGIV